MEWQKYDSQRAYDALMDAHQDTRIRPFNQKRIEIISRMIEHLGTDLRILDVGSGDGIIAEHLYEMGNDVTSLDLPSVVFQVHEIPHLLAVAGDAEKLTFASNIFDVVLASELLEHLWDPYSFVDEACRVLKNDGYLIISTPEGIEGLRYDAHKYFFTAEILEQILETKFSFLEITRFKPAFTATPTIILLFRKLAKSKN